MHLQLCEAWGFFNAGVVGGGGGVVVVWGVLIVRWVMVVAAPSLGGLRGLRRGFFYGSASVIFSICLRLAVIQSILPSSVPLSDRTLHTWFGGGFL